MSATYSLGVATPAAAAGAAYLAIRTNGAIRAYVREIGFFVNAATASSVGLIRATGTGTPSTSTLVQAGEPGQPAAVTNVDTAWTLAGTVGSIYLRRAMVPATIGNGVIWAFGPGELVIPISSGLFLWNFGGSAGSVLNAYVVLEE